MRLPSLSSSKQIAAKTVSGRSCAGVVNVLSDGGIALSNSPRSVVSEEHLRTQLPMKETRTRFQEGQSRVLNRSSSPSTSNISPASSTSGGKGKKFRQKFDDIRNARVGNASYSASSSSETASDSSAQSRSTADEYDRQYQPTARESSVSSPSPITREISKSQIAEASRVDGAKKKAVLDSRSSISKETTSLEDVAGVALPRYAPLAKDPVKTRTHKLPQKPVPAEATRKEGRWRSSEKRNKRAGSCEGKSPLTQYNHSEHGINLSTKLSDIKGAMKSLRLSFRRAPRK